MQRICKTLFKMQPFWTLYSKLTPEFRSTGDALKRQLLLLRKQFIQKQVKCTQQKQIL